MFCDDLSKLIMRKPSLIPLTKFGSAGFVNKPLIIFSMFSLIKFGDKAFLDLEAATQHSHISYNPVLYTDPQSLLSSLSPS